MSTEKNTKYISILLRGDGKRFFDIETPCGEKVSYGVNELPTENVKCPGNQEKCGFKDCWIIKWE